MSAGVSGLQDLWLRRFHSAPGAAARLVCFPHAGGAAGAYYALSQLLAPAVEVVAVQYPGRQDRRREPPVDDIVTLAERIAEVLAVGGGPALSLFGHSMGATVAYEVARILEGRSGVPVRALFVSGRRAPSRHRPTSVRWRDDDEAVAALLTLSGTDARLLADEDARAMILPAVRADNAAIEAYRRPPGADPSCPISVFVGDSDPLTSVEEARAWAAHTSAETEVQVFAAGHFFLDEYLREIAAAITRRLLPVPSGPVH
ncbi:Surfactin synthase thioesterase subunit [Sinosporangium album]|uniref:Surfactin synthase thioesterase subunit n=1 Tax=Sinosporangium album TaxID=504805 RepID=A0A1G7YDM4_9ACTN|nr:alpha/beta fold hydrolase [Sinosporangium album]SDG94426.1 Surfactin synthase thioesterase subunit [Sinosporangium album]